jgi:hypothetical protein
MKMQADERCVGIVEVMNLARLEICLRVMPPLDAGEPVAWTAPAIAEVAHWDRRDALECRVIASRMSPGAAEAAVSSYLSAMGRTVWRIIVCEEA